MSHGVLLARCRGTGRARTTTVPQIARERQPVTIDALTADVVPPATSEYE